MGDRWRRHHEVSILIAGKGGVGRYFGSQPRAKVSMMIMRLPQHGHGCGSTRGSSIAAFGGSGCFEPLDLQDESQLGPPSLPRTPSRAQRAPA
jgi:hypothetical protein